MADQFARGRAAFARHAWEEAYTHLAAPADESGDASTVEIGAADLECLAVAAYMLGKDAESDAAWEAAHRRHLAVADPANAARCSFWLALCLLLRGQMGHAGGWLSRTRRVIESTDAECAAAGYVLIPELLGALDRGDACGAHAMSIEAREIGERVDDPDLRALATLASGQALIELGDLTGGTARLDEVMVSVTAGEVGPITAGVVYCAVILECMRVFDLSRASEWTTALSEWCEGQPGLVPFRGQCLVHRSQVQQFAGEWSRAAVTAELASQRLADPPHPALGSARYQVAELLRLRGELGEAAAQYREASRDGCEPMPGLALLQLCNGDADLAAATVSLAVQEASMSPTPSTLAAAVDIFCAVGDVVSARAAAEDLDRIALAATSPMLTAMAEQARGTVLLADGDPRSALAPLRSAATAWRQLQMPYHAARAATQLARSCAALGDLTTANLELDNARETFRVLGARPDLEQLESVAADVTQSIGRDAESVETHGLSVREREVLAHVAAGRSNREIASALVISQHTVSRHLENIFTKLGVTNRAAATAYAYEHGLL